MVRSRSSLLRSQRQTSMDGQIVRCSSCDGRKFRHRSCTNCLWLPTVPTTPQAEESFTTRRRNHQHQQGRLRIGEVELVIAAQQRHQHARHRRARLARRRPKRRPSLHQSPCHRRPLRRCSTHPRLHHFQLKRRPQRRPDESRCHPVSSTNSVRIRPSPARSAARYGSASFFVTACHCAIVSSIETGRTRIRPLNLTPGRSGGFRVRQQIRLRGGFS